MTAPEMATYTGRRGNTINVGDYMRDQRNRNTRTLHVDRLYENACGAFRAACTVVGVDGVAIATTRTTDIAAVALAGPDFLPTTAPAAIDTDTLHETVSLPGDSPVPESVSVPTAGLEPTAHNEPTPQEKTNA